MTKCKMEIFLGELFIHINSLLSETEGVNTIKYKKGEGEQRCPITLVDFADGENISQLQCGHVFKCEAIKEWINGGHHACPMCRGDIHADVDVYLYICEKIKKVRDFVHTWVAPYII